MIPAVLLAFLVGVAVGLVLGRRTPARPGAVPAAARSGPSAVDKPLPALPSKRAVKAGMTEDDFRPADDILDKLRLAAEGKLDPAALTGDEPVGRAEAPPPSAPDRPELTEAERRVLDRLRAQERDSDAS